MLAEHPTCTCGEPSAEVHHLISVRERPDLRLDVANLQCLCRSCHSRITARTQAFGRGMR
ncbi:HNH endonuclease signature motif containing protein [Ancylobacter polymorphus]|uniref:HNH endonuclease signature motif containing protein n=1 Tax=Ancylobacter polymorphus TaxID=223390 RepID=UPI003D767F3C